MAPQLAGNNCITKLEDAMIDAFSQMTKFYDFLQLDPGVTDKVAESRKHIKLNAIPEPDVTQPSGEVYSLTDWKALFPLLRIEMPEDGGTQWEVSSHGNTWGYRRTWAYDLLFCRFLDPALDANDEEALRRLGNDVGATLEQLSNSPLNFGVTDFQVFENPSFGHMSNPEQFCVWKWRVMGRVS